MPTEEELERARQRAVEQILEDVRSGVAAHVKELRAIEADLEEVIHFEKPAMEGMGKWLLATLVAINGAAALGLIGSFAQQLSKLRLPVIFFTCGVVCSVLSGLMERDIWAMAIRLRDSAKKIRRQYSEFEQIQSSEEFLEKTKKLDVKFRGGLLSVILKTRGFAAQGFFYLSLMCFVGGVITAGLRLS